MYYVWFDPPLRRYPYCPNPFRSYTLTHETLEYFSANDGYGPGDADDFDDDDDSEVFHFADGGFDAAPADGGGGEGGPALGTDGVFVDNFAGEGLLSAGRRVEKISVK